MGKREREMHWNMAKTLEQLGGDETGALLDRLTHHAFTLGMKGADNRSSTGQLFGACHVDRRRGHRW
jgi:hypothetical protein